MQQAVLRTYLGVVVRGERHGRRSVGFYRIDVPPSQNHMEIERTALEI